MTLAQASPDVFVAQGPIVTVGPCDLAMLKAAASASPRRRARINAHPDGEDTLHEMIIAIDAASYIRPHKHPGKSESFHIIEGEVDVVLFGDEGELEGIVELGAAGGHRAFYYRMSKPIFHTLIVRSGILVVHEITDGPFRPTATVFAEFAPGDRDTDAAQAYQAELIQRVAAMRGTWT
jgi:cupin fold WbuC family metalloprotein